MMIMTVIPEVFPVAERVFQAPAVTIKRVYKNGSVSGGFRKLSRFFVYSEFASKLHNMAHKYFEEVQQCTDKNTIYRKNAQKEQERYRIY